MFSAEDFGEHAIGPPINTDLVASCDAVSAFTEAYAKRRYDRARVGDRLHSSVAEVLPDHLCHLSFKPLLQGDHCGVDIATSAHTAMLQAAQAFFLLMRR